MRTFLLCLLSVFAFAPAHAQVPTSREQVQLSYAPVVKKAAPAVVNIYTKTKVQVQENISPMMNDPFFRQFLGQQGLVMPGRTREQVVSSLGSGVIIKADGTVVTSHHVIKDAQQITVVLADKREFDASVVARDPQSDLAFLKIKADSLPYLEMQDSDALEVGDLVLAIGNPFGVGQTVTSGIISGLARKAAGVSDYQFFIQTDAAINPGNSGGALVNMDGKLIGINTAIFTKTGGYQGIGFAIPANMVKSLAGGKLEKGRVVRPWSGLAVQSLNGEIADSLGLKSLQGVLVKTVVKDSPADKAGLKVGDVILSVGGTEISSDQEMMYRIALLPLGEKAELQIMRAMMKSTVKMEMVAPPEKPARDLRRLKGRHPLDGVVAANLSPALAVEVGFDDTSRSGVVVLGLEQGMNMALRPGDIILEINGQKITSTEQLEKLLKTPQQGWQVAYQRGPQVMTLTVRM